MESEDVDGSEAVQWVIWSLCLVVYVVTLGRFGVVWWRRRNDDVWRQRSREEFESWSYEMDYDKFQKVDSEHFHGTNFENPIQKGDFGAC